MSNNQYRPRLDAEIAPLIEQLRQMPKAQQQEALKRAIEVKQDNESSTVDDLYDNPLFIELLQKFQKAGKVETKTEENLPKPYLNGNPDNILVIGDTHFPFCKSGYLSFVREQQERFDCGRIVHIGDECDNAAMSF